MPTHKTGVNQIMVKTTKSSLLFVGYTFPLKPFFSCMVGFGSFDTPSNLTKFYGGIKKWL